MCISWIIQNGPFRGFDADGVAHFGHSRNADVPQLPLLERKQNVRTGYAPSCVAYVTIICTEMKCPFNLAHGGRWTHSPRKSDVH